MITESLAIIETYAYLRPLAYVAAVAVVVFLICFVALQRAGRSKQ